MTFDARAVLEEIVGTHQNFTFLDMQGNEFSLPNIQLLTGEQVARLMGGDESVIQEINAEAYSAIQTMPIGVGEKLAEAWIDAGGEAGKEQSESAPVPTDGIPSELTSPPVV